MPTPEVELIEQDQDGNPCHRYLLEGREIPGISYILMSNGFTRYGSVKESVMQAARERGYAAHYATRLYDEDNPKELRDILDWAKDSLTEDLDPWTHSRLTGWIKFRKDFQFVPVHIENPMSHCWNSMYYGMTPDRIGYSIIKPEVLTCFEIKTTAEVEPSCAIQTAFQVQPFKKDTEIKRFCVQLIEDDYRIHEFSDRQDERIAAAALALVYWKWGKGIR